jgi:hypothetical protein
MMNLLDTVIEVNLLGDAMKCTLELIVLRFVHTQSERQC